jgi:hypothetical protein
MADVKWEKYKNHRNESINCFAKISGNNLMFNVKASSFLKDHKRVDVLYDATKLKITFIPNDEGHYALVFPKGRKSCIVCIQSLLSEIVNVNKDKRYIVTQLESGLSITLERIGE